MHTSVRIDLRDLHVKYMDYSKSANPPILHRKETFVATTYPLYETFSELTKQEVERGLLENANSIGNRNAWEQKLKAANIVIEDHCLRRANDQTGSILPE